MTTIVNEDSVRRALVGMDEAEGVSRLQGHPSRWFG